MPVLEIITNVPGNGLDNSDVLKAFSSLMKDLTGKPEKFIFVTLNTDKPTLFAGTEEPAVFAKYYSIGNPGGENNKKISKSLSDLVTAKLGVRPDRFYLSFVAPERADFGWNGSTFA